MIRSGDFGDCLVHGESYHFIPERLELRCKGCCGGDVAMISAGPLVELFWACYARPEDDGSRTDGLTHRERKIVGLGFET